MSPCKIYSNFKNKFQGETVKSKDPYPWLEPIDPRRDLTDWQIIESTIGLNQSIMSKEEQEEVYNLLAKYREAFSLGDVRYSCQMLK